jgi:hypothetical protein
MGGVGGGQHPSAGLVELDGVAISGPPQGIIAIPECRCSALYQPKHCFKNARASWMEPNRSGKPGRYFKVLNWLSEYGLSLLTWGGSGLGDPQVGQQERDRLGSHGAAPVGMHGRGAREELLLGAGGGEQPLGQRGPFGVGGHPADDIAAEAVQEHLQVGGGPGRRAQQPGDVPAPQLVRLGRQQLRPA